MHKLLFLVWKLALGGSLLLDARLIDDPSSWKLRLRLASSVVLVVAGIATARQAKGLWKIPAWLVAIGMLLGFLGDSTMASVLKVDIFPNRILGGMVFFGLGHLAYIAAVELIRRRLSLSWNNQWWAAIIFWQLASLVAWYFVVYSSGKDQPLHLPALGYTALLAATAGMTAGLAIHCRPAWLMAVGAALFLISDVILAWQIFGNPPSGSGFFVWATYGPGQMLIVFGFYLLMKSRQSA